MYHKATSAPWWRTYFLSLCGMIFLITGSILIVFPFIPWVYGLIFLLWATSCFAHASELLYRWMISLRLIGPPIKRYLDGGISPQMRRTAIRFVAACAGVGIFFQADWKVALLYLGAALLITLLPSRGRRPFV